MLEFLESSPTHLLSISRGVVIMVSWWPEWLRHQQGGCCFYMCLRLFKYITKSYWLTWMWRAHVSRNLLLAKQRLSGIEFLFVLATFAPTACWASLHSHMVRSHLALVIDDHRLPGPKEVPLSVDCKLVDQQFSTRAPYMHMLFSYGMLPAI